MKERLVSVVTVLATMAASVMPMAASAAVDTEAISPGDRIKCESLPAVYLFGPDGKRYVFPNEKTYFTWYEDFEGVKTISDKRCSTLPLGRSNVTYRPGSMMIKITTDPRTYVVERGGILRHIPTQEIAETYYGLNWKDRIHDVPDAFFSNYKVGDPITAASQYDPESVMTATATIMADKSFDEEAATISIGDVDAGFVPLTLTIKKGTNVTWVNRDVKDHKINGESVSSGTLPPNAEHSQVFRTVGSYTYSDTIYPTMTAVINVVE